MPALPDSNSMFGFEVARQQDCSSEGALNNENARQKCTEWTSAIVLTVASRTHPVLVRWQYATRIAYRFPALESEPDVAPRQHVLQRRARRIAPAGVAEGASDAAERCRSGHPQPVAAHPAQHAFGPRHRE